MKIKNDYLSRLLSATKALALIIVTTMVFMSCSDDDDNNMAQPESIVAIASSNTNLSVLVDALSRKPDLVSALGSSGTYTVFAPTNEAFSRALQAIGQTSLDDIPDNVLRAILEYHVISTAAVRSSQLANQNYTTVSGEAVAVNISGGAVTLNGAANVTTADVEASNGVVHVIDEVLIPPSIAPIIGTIVAPAYFNRNFSILVDAVVQANLLGALLNPDADLTVFAPTNAAFAAAGITSLPSNNDLLSSILLYHVVEGRVLSTDLPSTSEFAPAAIPTLGGQSFFLTNRGSGVFINGTTEVVATDIEGSNGVVHVINRTLIPPTTTIAGLVIDQASANPPQFTQLLGAVVALGLDETLSSMDGNFTVFAPTDAAFEALYNELDVDGLEGLVELLGVDAVRNVVLYHVVGTRVFSSDLADGDVTTAAQLPLTINAGALTLTDGSGGTSNLVATSVNLNTINGVVHVIDRVLLP